MIIGIISDTHGCNLKTMKAVQVLNDQNVTIVIHCGDFCSYENWKLFLNTFLNFRYVIGNEDSFFNTSMENYIDLKEHILEFEIENKKFGVFHNTYPIQKNRY